MKMGRLANISLPPVISCKPDAPCTERCYAKSAYRLHPNVKKAWDQNLRIYQAYPVDYFNQVDDYLKEKMPAFFRWHVSGDIPDQFYLDCMRWISKYNPETKFLCFTKQFDFSFRKIKNLKFVLSRWPGDTCDVKGPMAWMQDGTETRIPKSAHHCYGRCDECFSCWSLRKNQHIFFEYHNSGIRRKKK
jgi:hypothetical protein